MREREVDADLRATASYTYDLPNELIATAPAEPRDAARLLVARADGTLEHRHFNEFPALFSAGDVLVVNETRVIRARLRGQRDSGGFAEILLLQPADGRGYDPAARRWHALVRPGRRLHPGARIRFAEHGSATVGAVFDDGVREIELDMVTPLEELLERHGEMPLPPYVGGGDEARALRYQTIFARVPGSVAAPTASLHFTERTFADLRARGVVVVPLVLEVGFATFKPMSAARIDEHHMHAERYEIAQSTADAIASARRRGKRIVAAGTTTLRALESAAGPDGTVRTGAAQTRLFITPGFRFRVVDALLTNFHLPGSTLLVLVSAFAGYRRIRQAYEAAIGERYRFYSFGDAMFVTIDAQATCRPIA